MKKVGIVDQAACPHNRPPWMLSDTEVMDLMRNFLTGKTAILEADALRVCRWAEGKKAAALLLAAVLAHHVQIDVVGGRVTLTPRAESPH